MEGEGLDRAKTPREAGFSMPAEWAPHERCYIAWPCNAATWFGYDGRVKSSYAEVARAIGRFEPVVVLARRDVAADGQRALGEEVEILTMEMDDSWIRDNGPIFVSSSQQRVAAVKFGFNGWGGRFTPYGRDATVPSRLAAVLGVKLFDGPMILEGGSITVDGQGTLLTTESCLLNPNRNPGKARADIEAALQDYLGIQRTLWLRQGIHGSVVDGHIDGVAAFVAPGKVMHARAKDPADPNFGIFEENRARLQTMTDARGRSLEVLDIPIPRRRQLDGHRVAATYANFYIANGGVVVPTFGEELDRAALEAIATAFPDHEVVGVRGEYIGVGGGVVHCITQQQPRGRLVSEPDGAVSRSS